MKVVDRPEIFMLSDIALPASWKLLSFQQL